MTKKCADAREQAGKTRSEANGPQAQSAEGRLAQSQGLRRRCVRQPSAALPPYGCPCKAKRSGGRGA